MYPLFGLFKPVQESNVSVGVIRLCLERVLVAHLIGGGLQQAKKLQQAIFWLVQCSGRWNAVGRLLGNL